MKKVIFFFWFGALAAFGLLLVSCDKDTETIVVDAPAITVSVATVTASAEGGAYGFTYAVSNPAKDGSVTYSSSTGWISDITDTGTGINFMVAENNNEDFRTGRVEVLYSSSAGSVGKSVTVTQNAYTTPKIVVQPTAVAAEIEGGNYYFTYTITNPADDGEVSCSTNVSWISGFHYTTGRVSFDVAENDDPSRLRQGTITIVYSYGTGSVEEAITVYQDHEGGGVPSTVDDLVGTYRVDGDAYYSSGVAAPLAWTMKIYKASSTEVLIDGLTSISAGVYPDSDKYLARASLNSEGQLVIPTQFTGAYDSSHSVYIAWFPCTDYTGSSWTPSFDWLDCTLTYDINTGVWTSDYGMFLGGFKTDGEISMSSYSGMYDVSNPGFTITKRSSTTAVSLADAVAHPLGENLVLHTDSIF